VPSGKRVGVATAPILQRIARANGVFIGNFDYRRWVISPGAFVPVATTTAVHELHWPGGRPRDVFISVAILGAEPDIELGGEATDGEEAVARALELRPDVILMGPNIANVTCIGATRRILKASPDTAILMLTMFEDDDPVLAAMRAGAPGYVLKGADGAHTLRAIQAVTNGEAIISPTITRRSTG
jgi:CheY-like chemotaxis protein